MKIEVEIVTGFLGAGKTSFINSLIKESHIKGEKIIVIQSEKGESYISKRLIDNNSVLVLELTELKELNDETICLIKEYSPNRIIIEFNGTWDLSQLFKIGNENIYKENIRLERIYFVGDARNLKLYIENMGNFLLPFIEYSNIIVLNNTEYCDEKQMKKILDILNKLNPVAYILEVKNKYLFNSALIESGILYKGILKKIKITLGNSKNTLRRKKSEEKK